MADILIRGLEPSVVTRLRGLARRRGRSVQAEVRGLIEDAVERDDARREAVEFFDKMREELRGTPQDDSTELIREDRDSR